MNKQALSANTGSVSLTLTVLLASMAQAVDVPGVVIDHAFASTGCYVGSPSIAVLPNGDYVASHDLFGPKSGCDKAAQRGPVDRGTSMKHRGPQKMPNAQRL
jgi:hypothetical protein